MLLKTSVEAVNNTLPGNESGTSESQVHQSIPSKQREIDESMEGNQIKIMIQALYKLLCKTEKRRDK